MKLSARLLALVVLTFFTVGNANAAGTLAPVQVFSDPALDQPTFLEATPPYQDLIAGYISETADNLIFTWEVADIPDPLTNGVPELAVYYWEFTLDAPGDNVDPIPFSLRASTHRGTATGELESAPCTTENNLITCAAVGGARVTVTVDAAKNQITASVRRRDLRTNGAASGGTSVAVDGATLEEVDLFQGIAAFTSAVAAVPGATGDPADLDDVYVLGSAR
jgi:hypothetical protein